MSLPTEVFFKKSEIFFFVMQKEESSMNVWKKLTSQSLNKNFFSFSSIAFPGMIRERKKKELWEIWGKKDAYSIYLSIYAYSF